MELDVNLTTTPNALRHAVNAWPDFDAVVIEDQRLTYSELYKSVVICAANLYRLGLRPKDHIAICMGNTAEWVITAFAANFVGAVIIPVNTRFKSSELLYQLEQSDASFLVIADQFLKINFIDMLGQVEPAIHEKLPGAVLPKLKHLIVLGSNIPNAGVSFDELLIPDTVEPPIETLPEPDDIALIQYTSGTTSFPKGVMLRHVNLTRNAWHVGLRIGLGSGDRYYSGRPLYHVAGTTLSMIACTMSGACYITAPSFEPGNALEVMEREKCTVTSGNDTMFMMLMDHPNFPKTKLFLRSALAATSPEVSNKMFSEMGITGLCAGYGLSESSPTSVMGPYDDILEKRLTGYGFPLPGVEVRIFDPETFSEVPPGIEGEIRVRGWNLMAGYYKMEAATLKSIDTNGWLHTGDLGVADKEGRIRFVDRLKDMFRVGGENVAPADVENVLNAHPAVRQAQVVGVPDKRLTQVAAAYVILKADKKATEAELIAWCKEKSAGFKVPRYVRFVDSFEPIGMTGSSKVQRNKLLTYAINDLGL